MFILRNSILEKLFALRLLNNRANEISLLSRSEHVFPVTESGLLLQEHDHSVKRTIPCYQNNPKASLIDLSVFPPTFHGCVVLVNPPRVSPASNPEEHCFNPLSFSRSREEKGALKKFWEYRSWSGYTGNFITLIPRSVIILLQLFKNPRSRGHERRGGGNLRDKISSEVSQLSWRFGWKGLCHFVR